MTPETVTVSGFAPLDSIIDRGRQFLADGVAYERQVTVRTTERGDFVRVVWTPVMAACPTPVL
jgi:hypothetical protein